MKVYIAQKGNGTCIGEVLYGSTEKEDAIRTALKMWQQEFIEDGFEDEVHLLTEEDIDIKEIEIGGI